MPLSPRVRRLEALGLSAGDGVPPDLATDTLSAGDKLLYSDASDGGNIALVSVSVLVAGPASATDDALVRFDGTTGSILQNSVATLTDAGLLTVSEAVIADTDVAEMVLSRTDAHGNVNVGSIVYRGKDSVGGVIDYAEIIVDVIDNTNGSEDSRYLFNTAVAGVVGTRLRLGAGLSTEGVTGGDKGTGTVNAATFYKSGFLLVTARAWGMVTGGTSPAFAASFNMTSVARTAVGKYTLTWDVNFGSAAYAYTVLPISTSALIPMINAAGSLAAGNADVWFYDVTGALADPVTGFTFTAFGDQ